MEEIAIKTDFIKLDALLKYSSLCSSGGEAKYVISEGLVTVNDEVCTARGKKIFPGDTVKFNNMVIRAVNEG